MSGRQSLIKLTAGDCIAAQHGVAGNVIDWTKNICTLPKFGGVLPLGRDDTMKITLNGHDVGSNICRVETGPKGRVWWRSRDAKGRPVIHEDKVVLEWLEGDVKVDGEY
jgi:hypothetical protein